MFTAFLSSRLLLALRPFIPYFLGILVILGTSYFLYSKGYSNGSNDKDAEYQIVIEKERERILSANLEALETARETAKFLQLQVKVLDEEIRIIQQEAALDPNATNISISIDGVRRLNRIR